MSVSETCNRRGTQDVEEQKLDDAMLSAIFKTAFDDSMPDMHMDIYKTGRERRRGLEVPAVIEFRSLPAYVQDNISRAEILPTKRPWYKRSGKMRVFRYEVMMIFRHCRCIAEAKVTNTPLLLFWGIIWQLLQNASQHIILGQTN